MTFKFFPNPTRPALLTVPAYGRKRVPLFFDSEVTVAQSDIPARVTVCGMRRSAAAK
ncbi:hypothetical protein EVJ58_g652 [Rhodofomes roseus]|uniref:Uncharacterized protein n=1 Tax=Rhodofomes roseus TaxID=34475 RepID=A0A4Y9Z3B1_9APHY|nr:hypothetical protein EVJ58_g652 [Rhodofomes roseus]